MLDQTSCFLASLSNIRGGTPSLEVSNGHVQPNRVVVGGYGFVIKPVKSDVPALGSYRCLGFDSQFVAVVVKKGDNIRTRRIHQVGPEVATAATRIEDIVEKTTVHRGNRAHLTNAQKIRG